MEDQNDNVILSVRGLVTYFDTEDGIVRAVDGVDLDVHRGEVLGLVGESGCGKSVTSLSIIRLVGMPGKVLAGEIFFKGQDILLLEDSEMNQIRGNQISMIFQQPISCLNPVFRAGAQVAEQLKVHLDMDEDTAMARAEELFGMVGIPDPARRVQAYPHELSGGMAQRVMIAMALSCAPELLIADEPTTALDVSIQAQILTEMRDLAAETGTALVWISHDLATVSTLASRLLVMYAGRIVEQGPVATVLRDPRHPYTAGLLRSLPATAKPGEDLFQIPGATPSLLDPPPGCPFRPRCQHASEAGTTDPPLEVNGERGVRCFHPLRQTVSA